MRPYRFSPHAALLLALTLAPVLSAAEPFQDPKLPLEQRVDNLISLLTLDEKIAMLGQTEPAGCAAAPSPRPPSPNR
jgi:hypothetical protein